MNVAEIVNAAFLYALSLIAFAFYLYKKYKTNGYILSICNAYIFQYALILFVVTPMAFTPKAWIKLLGNAAYARAPLFYPYLLKSIELNCFGFFIFIIALSVFEFLKKKHGDLYKKIERTVRFTPKILLDTEFLLAMIIWVLYSLFVIGGFNLFGASGNSESGLIYYINQATQVIITMMTLFYGISYINRKHNLFFFVLGIIACVLMGKRATLIMDILWGIVVYALYRKVSVSKKVFRKAVKYAVLLVIVALTIGEVRSSSTDFTIVENLIYGNTFCDIRDGGMILYGFKNNAYEEWALGRTYLSALLSFIPSSLSALRLKWDWGRYSTTTLLGWKNHPGLRGGWAMEGYLNFGVLGIVLAQIISAKIYADMEKYFYMEMFEKEKRKISEKAVLTLYIYITLARRATCSAGFFAVYVLVLLGAINRLIGRILEDKRSVWL